MRIFGVFFLLLVGYSCPTHASEIIGFRGLITKTIFQGLPNCNNFPPIKISFNPRLGKPLNKFRELEDYPLGGIDSVLHSSLVAGKKAKAFRFDFDQGGSCDPAFHIYKDGSEEFIGKIDGEHLVIPGDGFLYVIRRSNSEFERKEKWQIVGGKVIEIAQPYRFVGIQTRARKSFQITSDLDIHTPIANISIGEKITVVMKVAAENDQRYLVKTPFGLVGWAQDASISDYEDRLFEDIYFFGD